MRRVIGFVLALFVSSAHADECPTPNKFISQGRKTWERHSTVFYAVDPTMPSAARLATDFAFQEWTKQLEGPTKLNVKFVPANGLHVPNITISDHKLGPNDLAGEREIFFRDDTKNLVEAEIQIDLSKFILGSTYMDAIEKIMEHEIGHTLGLDHPTDEQPKGSIMNNPRKGDPNDAAGWLPTSPTKCDKDRIHSFNKIDTTTGPRPPRMPSSLCGPCGENAFEVWNSDTEKWDTVIVDLWCCGHNAANLVPRPPGGPSWEFLATGYQCSDDGWIKANRGCRADLCCVNPAQLPEGGGVNPTPGTTCAAQGWWEADGKTACELSIQNQAPCVKKEVCGPGPCVPWPSYCWKPPFVPGGGGGGDDGGGGDEETGVSCSSKNWYNGDDLSSCERDHGSCARKQSCDGQTCLPAPYYCWQPQ